MCKSTSSLLFASSVLFSLLVSPSYAQLFTDVAVSSGINVTHDGASVADMGMGAGGAWFDYDNDGDLDLYMTMRTGANKLFKNTGGSFTDVAASAGAADAGHDGAGVVAFDYNNDGCKDLYLANSNADVLLKNNCNGTFTDITAGSGLEATGNRRGTSASVGDYDGDGFLDLYVAHHMPVDGYGVVDDKTKDQDYLFHNNGDGTWTDVSNSLLGSSTRENASFIAAWTDFDQDGDLDIYLIRDCGFDGSGPMNLWRNDGGTNGVSNWTFTEVSASTGSNFCQNGMGVAVGDYNRNGTMDLFYTDNGSAGSSGFPERAGTVLLKNNGGSFSDGTDAAGVSSLNFSWGANFFDYDLDGWLDLFMAGGSLNPGTDVSTKLWHNNANGTSFTDVTTGSGVIDLTRSRAGYFGDYDADGDPDLFLFNYGAAARLFRNDNANGNNYLIVDLQGTTSNRDGIGARIAVTAGGVTQHYETRSGSSLGGGDDTGAYFGLGTAGTVTSMTVTWPSGTVQTLTNLGVNQRMTVVEDGGVSATDLFTDVAAAAGVSVTHSELTGDMGMGTGAAWFDYDNDGDQDLYMTMRTGANKLFKNTNGSFTDVAASAGVADSGHDGSGVAVADYNNDGCKDLYLANGNDDVLFRNNCDGTFTNVTAGSGLGASEQRRGTSASWGDYDDDGFVDLYVAHHMPIEGNTFTGDGEQDYLYHNNGDGTFTDVSAMLLGANRIGRSFIAGWTDYDNDGDLDVYTIRDCPFGQNSGPMRLYRNDGGTNGVSAWTFTETSATANADYCQNGMGLAVGDYNRDGWMDFFYTDNGNETLEYPKSRDGTLLLKNTGGAFVDATDEAGVSSRNFSWGANFFDYDLDGWPDLFMAGGALNGADIQEDIALWHNNANGTSFTDVTGTSGMSDMSRSRTPVYADYDKDGDPDMFLVNYFGQTRLFKNNNTNGNNWLIVDLVGTTSNRDGIGARLALTAGGVTRYYETRSGSSLGGGDDLGAYFGLGSASSISSLVITWPSGTVQTLTGVGINQRLTVTEEGGGNVPPTASFTTTVSDLTVDVDASASSDNGSIVSYAWTFGDGATGTGVTASHTYAAYGTYTITLTVTDNEGATGSTTRTVTLTDGTGGTGAFVESGGQVTMEAENFTANIPRGDHSWVTSTANAGFSGVSAMITTPDNGAQITVDVENTSPELAFDVNFTTTGTYYMWGRVWAPGSNGDRMHFGFDGAIPSNSNGVISKTVYNSWQWVDMIGSGTRQTIDVSTPGVHEVNVWMREDGMLIDKIVLTTDAGFTPTGTGPAESPRDGSGGGNPAPIASFTATTTDLTVNVDASASTDDGSIVSYAWTFGDGATGTGVTASHTYGAAGTYSVVLTVTDDMGATGSTSQNVTVTSNGGGGTGSFIESAGMVVMEAENFHTNIERSSHSWVLDTAKGGFSGGGSMVTTPDNGTQIKNSVTSTSPEMGFSVTFGTTGNYYLWGRVWAPDSKAKTVHIGNDGQIPSNVNGLATTTYGEWVWVDLVKTGLRQTLNIATAGEHEINVWMREDGLAIDKIVMTTDANFTPSGIGPDESPRTAAPVAAKAGAMAPALNLMAAQDLPTEFALEGNYPNPFNPTTTIRFALPEAAPVRLEVYDAMGRRIATLLDSSLEAGRHEAMWDGRTDAGVTVASGVYLYRIDAGSFSAVKSMLLVK
ncbi:MAG: FG-GAP-like repeat-containing protein [Rhodothermales bacterium]